MKLFTLLFLLCGSVGASTTTIKMDDYYFDSAYTSERTPEGWLHVFKRSIYPDCPEAMQMDKQGFCVDRPPIKNEPPPSIQTADCKGCKCEITEERLKAKEDAEFEVKMDKARRYLKAWVDNKINLDELINLIVGLK